MFRFDLAEALGKFPHEIDAMPQEDFVAFMIKHQKSPLGTHRADIRHAHTMHQTARVNSNPKKPFTLKPYDFQLFKNIKPKGPMSDSEIEAAAMGSLSRI